MIGDEGPFLVAVVYARGGGGVVGRVAETARRHGLALVGMIQKDEARSDRRKCDLSLVDLASSREIRIFQDRGADARGCLLDHAALEEASGLVAAGLVADPSPDLLILSKFGAREIEGHGFRQVIERAVERGVPVMVGVGAEHVEGFRAFAGGLERVVSSEAEASALIEALAARAAARGLVPTS